VVENLKLKKRWRKSFTAREVMEMWNWKQRLNGERRTEVAVEKGFHKWGKGKYVYGASSSQI
jgi:hypothetical protein